MVLDARQMATQALILSDGKPGHVNQSRALCRALDWNFEELSVDYPRRIDKGLTYLWDRLGIYNPRFFRAQAFEIEPDVIVSAGSATYYPNKSISRKLFAPNIAILAPRGYRPDFNWMVVPSYDRAPRSGRLVSTPVNLSFYEFDDLSKKIAEFRQRTPQPTTRPAIGVILGGSNSVASMDPDSVRQWLTEIFEATPKRMRWITTSRRTSPEVEAVIEDFEFDRAFLYSQEPYNPIPAFTEICERLFVSDDSASMVSECVSYGDSFVEILSTKKAKTPNKFDRFVESLTQADQAHIFDGRLGSAREKVDLRQLLAPIRRAFNPIGR